MKSAVCSDAFILSETNKIFRKFTKLSLLQLKEKGETSNGKPEAAEELREAIFLAEETHPGICDSLVAELVQRLQR